uniref:Uncharacterized protein n=1 Tax=Nelumbo nucifera TaxID=4432 RepID=A0A822YYS5_NELNU|nr:TPA_asm: hypothetical protein HUJ06_008301 [Nelumbo nucifera]
MFNSIEWSDRKWAKEAKGRRVAKTATMPSFWNNIVYILKVNSPLVRVLRLVDRENKMAMGYIYEAVDRAEEAIQKAFDDHENKPAMGYIYEAVDRANDAIQKAFDGKRENISKVFEIIDRRWEYQLHQPLHAIGFYLNPQFYYDDAERIDSDKEIINGLYKVIQMFESDKNKSNTTIDELSRSKNAEGIFGEEIEEENVDDYKSDEYEDDDDLEFPNEEDENDEGE